MLLLLEVGEGRRNGGIVLGNGCGEGSKGLSQGFVVWLSHGGAREGTKFAFVLLLFAAYGAKLRVVRNGCERS